MSFKELYFLLSADFGFDKASLGCTIPSSRPDYRTLPRDLGGPHPTPDFNKKVMDYCEL